jgi:hypothetical protein
VVNGFGAMATALVMGIFAVTKFREGAWIVLVLIPLVVMMFLAIHRHYKDIAGLLSLEDYAPQPRVSRQRVIMPISGVHRGTLAALRYARTLSQDITVVHVSIDPANAEKVRNKWEFWGDGVRLVILESPYRLLMEPLLQYIDRIYTNCQPNEVITVVVPEFVPKRRWQHLLHTQTALTLRLALRSRPGIVVTDVPYVYRPEVRPPVDGTRKQV